jgi:hypothetical protein
MKKFYLMFISLLCIAFSAQAQVVTNLDQLSNDKVYTIKSARAFLLYSPNCTKIASSTGKSVGNVTFDPQDPNQQFKIENVGGKYYLYSVGAGKYVYTNGMFNANTVTPLNISQSSSATYRWFLKIGTQGLNSQEPNQTAEGVVVNDYVTQDAGNCYSITEVTDVSQSTTHLSTYETPFSV